jgi:hypothetical protein
VLMTPYYAFVMPQLNVAFICSFKIPGDSGFTLSGLVTDPENRAEAGMQPNAVLYVARPTLPSSHLCTPTHICT